VAWFLKSWAKARCLEHRRCDWIAASEGSREEKHPPRRIEGAETAARSHAGFFDWHLPGHALRIKSFHPMKSANRICSIIATDYGFKGYFSFYWRFN